MTLLTFMNLFEAFKAPSWDGWRGVLARITDRTREVYGIVGRGAGKSLIAALLACYFGARQYERAPGEQIYVGVFAPDRKQARITFKYIVGLLRSVPALAALIVNETRESIELSTGVVIEVITASVASPRGRSYVLVIVEEAAFLPTDAAANPDLELLRAVRPALARVPGSLLVVVSSPYAKRGVLWTAFQKFHDKPDGDVLLVKATTLDLNPTFDRRAIEAAYADDPASASAEYGAEFRGDLESLFERDRVEACVVPGRVVLPPMSGVHYRAFVDPSGGSADSMTLAIVHSEQGRAVLDCVEERRPPFSPESVVADFAALLQAYHLSRVTGDRYGGEWPRERFQVHDITYDLAEQSRSELYLALLPVVNSGQVDLLDSPRLVAQLCGLERRTARGGKDSVDHGPGGHDDLANAAAGAIVALSSDAEVNDLLRVLSTSGCTHHHSLPPGAVEDETDEDRRAARREGEIDPGYENRNFFKRVF